MVKKCVDLAHRLLAKRFVRFLVVGGINTVFGYGVFALLIFFGLHYSVAAFISTMLGILFNFKTTGILVFRSHDNVLVFRFVAVYAVVYAFNVAGLKIFSLAGVNGYIGGALLILPAAVLSYVLNKTWVFCRSRVDGASENDCSIRVNH